MISGAWTSSPCSGQGPAPTAAWPQVRLRSDECLLSPSSFFARALATDLHILAFLGHFAMETVIFKFNKFVKCVVSLEKTILPSTPIRAILF